VIRPARDAAILDPHQLDVGRGQLVPEFALDGGHNLVSQRSTDVLLERVLRRPPEARYVEVRKDLHHFEVLRRRTISSPAAAALRFSKFNVSLAAAVG
jgi:hypothetical protein